jgi:hypothetical protein
MRAARLLWIVQTFQDIGPHESEIKKRRRDKTMIFEDRIKILRITANRNDMRSMKTT